MTPWNRDATAQDHLAAAREGAERDRVVEVLQRAKERVAAGWWNGALHDGDEVKCAAQAIYHQHDVEIAIPCRLLAQAVTGRQLHEYTNALETVITWNDTPGRTQAEVLDAFDAAIRLAKERP
jgi:hypothetical protein